MSRTRQDGRVPIDGFEDYVVDRAGNVYTARRGHLRKPSMTQEGAMKITLYRDGVPFTKSVARIVANAHLYNDHDPEIFDTPIHLDNDIKNNHVDNLAWRPRWFAVKFQKQYWDTNFRHAKTKVQDEQTGVIYPNLVEPCQQFGLLYMDIIKSCTRHTYVFPTWKTFRFVD